MADIEESLRDAYTSSLNTNKTLTLSWMKYFSDQVPANLQEWHGAAPVLFYYFEDPEIDQTCQEGPLSVDKKIYRMRFVVLAELFNKSYLTKSPSVPTTNRLSQYRESLEALYKREDFDISEAAWMTEISNGVVSIPGAVIEGRTWAEGFEMVIEHDWHDQRTS